MISPSRTELYEAFAPYVVERFSVESDEWRQEHRRLLRSWRRTLWWRRLSRLRFNVPRNQESLRYIVSWRDKEWPSVNSRETDLYNWGSDAFKARKWAMKRVHQRLLWHCIQQLKPRTVLEVGAGNGINLLPLSGGFEGISWTGIELSPSGVERAKGAQSSGEPQILSFGSWPIVAPQAYREIDFLEGNAKQLPFADNSFELVFSVLALEQMEEIRNEALSEMARVSSKWVVMIEPFEDFNREALRRTSTRAKGYMSLRTRELKRFGLNPIFVLDDIPQKITRGAGLVICSCQSKPRSAVLSDAGRSRS
jgi:SAM-dependent methyltransferase